VRRALLRRNRSSAVPVLRATSHAEREARLLLGPPCNAPPSAICKTETYWFGVTITARVERYSN
jgi:hypothetical protein